MSKLIYILLPAYNEEASLRTLILEITDVLTPLKHSFCLCVVDDGSTDGTRGLLKILSADVPLQSLHHEMNQGYGAALRTGFSWIAQQGRPEDIAVSLDADRTHFPSYIPAMIEKLEQDFDAVIASYQAPRGGVSGLPLQRKILSVGANFLFRLAARVPGLQCYTNGFRAYRVGALQKVFAKYGTRMIEENGFAGGTELLLKVCRAGGRVSEIPFRLHYEYRKGQSNINIPQTIAGYLRLLRRQYLPL
jgi:dolichol-phosphate mannosyltransferase